MWVLLRLKISCHWSVSFLIAHDDNFIRINKNKFIKMSLKYQHFHSESQLSIVCFASSPDYSRSHWIILRWQTLHYLLSFNFFLSIIFLPMKFSSLSFLLYLESVHWDNHNFLLKTEWFFYPGSIHQSKPFDRSIIFPSHAVYFFQTSQCTRYRCSIKNCLDHWFFRFENYLHRIL